MSGAARPPVTAAERWADLANQCRAFGRAVVEAFPWWYWFLAAGLIELALVARYLLRIALALEDL